ncbi:MAG: UbiA family prenyltransferase [Betaproteobacteria bacterium]
MSVSSANAPCLCVDLDGTLVRSDLLAESLLLLLALNPLYLLAIPFWLLRGKAWMKHEIAWRARLDPALLPFHQPLLQYLIDAKRDGRKLVLATASDRVIADDVAAHLGLFSAVHASDGKVNLRGENKAALLREWYGQCGFTYIGNSVVDLPVWRAAGSAILVNTSRSLARRAQSVAAIAKDFGSNGGGMVQSMWRALRPHQWVKNLLLLVPLIAAHKLNSAPAVQATAQALGVMCLLTSAIYLINDLLDLKSDRLHAGKRERPFASGALSLWIGMAMALTLLAVVAALAMLLPQRFQIWILVYALVAILYSFLLKRWVVVDVMVLALLYTLRLLIGAAAIAVPVSAWLLTFAMFFFLSLALLKRFAEIDRAAQSHGAITSIRGYRVGDRHAIGVFGAVSGYLATLVMALYVDGREIGLLYRHPDWLWGLCPLFLFWITRTWLIGFRGEMDDDPVIFALKEPTTYVVAVAICICMLLAL